MLKEYLSHNSFDQIRADALGHLSVASFSNIDDIEGFVAGYEAKHGLKCLTRIDIAADQREIVEEELQFMGITAASLFPGFEGVCKSLRSELC